MASKGQNISILMVVGRTGLKYHRIMDGSFNKTNYSKGIYNAISNIKKEFKNRTIYIIQDNASIHSK